MPSNPSNTTNDYAQDVGRLEGRMDSVDRRIEQLEASVKHLTDLVVELKSGQDQFKGGYTLLAAVIGVAGSVGAAITWVLEHVTFK